MLSVMLAMVEVAMSMYWSPIELPGLLLPLRVIDQEDTHQHRIRVSQDLVEEDTE